MTNFEKIKNMSVEEMAVAIVNGISSDPCDYCEKCECFCHGNGCLNLEDNEIVQKWLEREEKKNNDTTRSD